MSEVKSNAGRKTKYSDALAELICNQLASGKTLKSICALPNMPAECTVHRWLKEEDKMIFRESYGGAKLIQYDVLWDSTIDIARGDKSNDSMIKIQRDALEIKTITNYVGKLNPVKYGGNPVPVAPINTMPQVDINNVLTLEEQILLMNLQRKLEAAANKNNSVD